ncbi:MAG: TIGR02453 family protein [Acidimicrobiales bacterium]|nr:MAG: TIGR02453 family protein [Acidimicrobiales bacterium]
MAFTGWPVEAIEFFERLEDDNTKAFWNEQKHVYEDAVKAPMVALLADLEKRFGEGKVFRPYRDVRFSKDKTPYKTNIAARMAGGPYISLSADGFGVGTGYYMMAKDQLASFRAAVDDDTTGRQLERTIVKVTGAGIDVTSHDAVKTAPRGYSADHPRIELLRMKGCIAWQEWEIGAWLDTAEAKDRIVDFMGSTKPLVKWLDTNVGPSELEGGWG